MINQKGAPSLEITVSEVDKKLLLYIKTFFGGSIAQRTGTKAIRYRLHFRSGLLTLLHAVNGLIRNSIRQQQFKKMLNLFNIVYIEPKIFNWHSSYVSGLFDSDGSVVLSVKKHT